MYSIYECNKFKPTTYWIKEAVEGEHSIRETFIPGQIEKVQGKIQSNGIPSEPVIQKRNLKQKIQTEWETLLWIICIAYATGLVLVGSV